MEKDKKEQEENKHFFVEDDIMARKQIEEWKKNQLKHMKNQTN